MIDYYEEGFDAYACGFSIEMNPYSDEPFSFASIDWRQGWIDASYK